MSRASSAEKKVPVFKSAQRCPLQGCDHCARKRKCSVKDCGEEATRFCSNCDCHPFFCETHINDPKVGHIRDTQKGARLDINTTHRVLSFDCPLPSVFTIYTYKADTA